MKRTDRTSKKPRREGGATALPAAAAAPERPTRVDTRPRSRRDFMRLMAVGASAMLAAPATAAVKTAVKKAPADTTGRARRTRGGETVPTNGVHPMLPAELEKQKKYTADSLKTLRNYSLPPGAMPAYGFRPLARKSRRGRP